MPIDRRLDHGVTFRGLFQLQSPEDLLDKLAHDYDRFEKSQLDQYVAFDFFVTAEHVLDWLYPDDEDKTISKSNKERRKDVRSKSLLLQVCSHIASGSKHFVALDSRHVSVKDASKHEGAFAREAFSPTGFDVPRLEIRLQGEASRELGESIDAFELAGKVLDFWKNYKELQSKASKSPPGRGFVRNRIRQIDPG